MLNPAWKPALPRGGCPPATPRSDPQACPHCEPGGCRVASGTEQKLGKTPWGAASQLLGHRGAAAHLGVSGAQRGVLRVYGERAINVCAGKTSTVLSEAPQPVTVGCRETGSLRSDSQLLGLAAKREAEVTFQHPPGPEMRKYFSNIR